MTTPTLQVWIDFVCPWCFIGFTKLQRARSATQRSLHVDWLPFQLDPSMPTKGVPRAAYFEKRMGGAARAGSIWATAKAAGAAEGIALEFDRITVEPNTFDAHRSVRFAASAGRADALVARLFEAHFQKGLFLGDRRVLAALAGEAGLDGVAIVAHLDSGADEVETRSAMAEALALGVRSVPAYGVDDRLLPQSATADLQRLIMNLEKA